MGRTARDGVAEIRMIEASLERLKKTLDESERQIGAPGMAVLRNAADMARFVYVLRRIRDCRFGGDLFGEPAWDILLNLFIMRLEGRQATISSVCIAACTPASTALRWITTLVEAGMIHRTPDVHDARRVFLTLSDSAFGRMADVLDAMRTSVGDDPTLADDLAGKDRQRTVAGIGAGSDGGKVVRFAGQGRLAWPA